MKTIDVYAKEWFRGTTGNSYFSARVIIDFGLPSEKNIIIPFQYGYGSHYEAVALEKIREMGLIKADKTACLWSYCYKNGIIFRSDKAVGCTKREVIDFIK